MLLFLPAVLMVAGGAVLSPALAGSTPDQNRTCVNNLSGALNVDVMGVPGAPGPQGPQGEVGPGGARGKKGQQGAEGQRGTVGEPGPKGDEGLRGPIGSKGQKGIRGAEGLQGPQGERGVEGVVGPRGHLGTPGPEGGRGPVGPSGPQGIRGLQGEPGDTVLSKQEFERIRQQVYSSLQAEINATLETVKDDNAQVDRKVKLLMDADVKMDNKLLSLNSQDVILDSKLQALNATLQDAKLDEILESLDAEDTKLHSKLQALNVTLQGCCRRTLCGIYGPWRPVKYFNTKNGDSCPPHLRTVSNQGNTTRTCGRVSSGGSCSSVSIPVNTEYSQVCGIVRGYQYHSTDGFYIGIDSIDSYYVDGISITHGSPRRHLWTYATGVSEQVSSIPYRCPCARPDPLDRSGVPSFVGEDFYCESGFVDTLRDEVAWNDPLWDGAGCQSSGNQCCRRFGWFHRQVQPSSDDIELRICANEATRHEDTLLESYEFWVI